LKNIGAGGRSFFMPFCLLEVLDDVSMRSELVNNDSIYLSILEMFLELLNQF
jgi:hypothetical protein